MLGMAGARPEPQLEIVKSEDTDGNNLIEEGEPAGQVQQANFSIKFILTKYIFIYII